jgi:hypothetical protein
MQAKNASRITFFSLFKKLAADQGIAQRTCKRQADIFDSAAGRFRSDETPAISPGASSGGGFLPAFSGAFSKLAHWLQSRNVASLKSVRMRDV